MYETALQPDLESPAFRCDPYPVLAQLRARDPVHWNARLKGWVLTRHDDVRAALVDERLSSDRLRPFFAALPEDGAAQLPTLSRHLPHWMVFRDPPAHTRLRRLAAPLFSAARIAAAQPVVEATVARLLAALRDRRDFDFIAEFAGPLPALVVMRLLGVPEEELARLKRRSDELALFVGSARASPQKYAHAEKALRELTELFADLVAARRRAPRADGISALIDHARDQDDIGEDELVATCVLLLFAGHETTTNLLGNGLLALLEHPGELDKLRAEPALAARAVEELLRYDSPAASVVRVVRAAHERRGRRLAAGERVFVMLGAANRDPAVYAQPDRLWLARGGPSSLAFGYGPHLCLGFALARLEARVALPALLAAWRRIELAEPAARLAWHDSLVFRGLVRLPIAVRP